MYDEFAGPTCLPSLSAQQVRGCGVMKATVSPGLSMAVLPFPNPYGMLRIGRRGLNNPYGFWLFWLFASLFLLVVKTLA